MKDEITETDHPNISVADDSPPTVVQSVAPSPEPKKPFCSCTLINRYKKPMGFMLVILLLILNIVMIIVGVVQCDSSPCPIEAIIPIFLIGTGIIGIASRILLIVKYFRNIQTVVVNRILYGLLVAELIFLLTGSIWIFSNFRNKQYSCNGAAFTWTFIILIFYYIVLLSPLIIPCCIECHNSCFQQKLRVVAT